MKTMRLVAALIPCLLLGACYKRQPLATATPAPSTRIVAELTDTGTVVMGNSIGPGALEVEGVVSRATEAEWTLYVLRVDHRDGRSIAWNRELVSFPRAALSSPSVVVLDTRRSWLAAGATVAGAFLLARAFQLLGADDDDRDGGGPPPQELIVAGRRR